ncbi:MAG TPA: protein-L-isoaspartate(D-aspartate) O-methyltransferase [Phycisphaerae bacterium]|nr:protein-L-isoaspartate(D-aspartate) O-methyltransferase [Phycisphaerae bacterium]
MVDVQLRSRQITSGGVLEAFSEIPRERFIPSNWQHDAYDDCPVPIGYGQTISQPYVVALMVQELHVDRGHRVLDVGAGSGYQTAILARLARHVYAVERIADLAERAMATLTALNVSNVTMCIGDGSLGWPEESPFDRIICGAACPEAPQPWLDQLADGGRIVLPAGGQDVQTLIVIERSGDELRRRSLCDVRFVRLIGKEGWPG